MWKWFCSRVQNRSSELGKSFCHTAFSTSKEDFDLALEKMKEWGVRLHLAPICYRGGRTIYFFDSEGNYLQIGERGWEPS
jgi:predicted enzyme related to lactoylglutathione lyase